MLKKLEDRAQFEEQMISRYQTEMEARTNILMESRKKRYQDDQVKMREYLQKQMNDKKQREFEESGNINAQAKMWEIDQENWQKEESRLKSRVDMINKEN